MPLRVALALSLAALLALLAAGCGGSGTAACAHEYVIERFGYHWYEARGWQRAQATKVCRAHPHDANVYGPGSS